MVPLKDNKDLECFLVTKHSWKGKYKRILAIGNAGISTYNPDKSNDITNRWGYSDVVAVAPNKTPGMPHEFQLIVRKDRKTDTIKLSSEYRSDILTAMLKFYKDFADKPKGGTQKYDAKKHHWSGISFPTVLEVTPCSLDQLDPTTNTILASYNYKEINGIIGEFKGGGKSIYFINAFAVGVNDYDGGIGIAYGSFSRLHVFKALNHHEIVQNIVLCASQYLAIDIKVLKSQTSLDKVDKERFGKYSKDQSLTSMCEFIVQKCTHRHPDPVKRILCLTDATVLERDPQTYSVCTLRPLVEVYALIRDSDNIQMFSIEYKNGHVRSYLTNDR